MAMGQDGLSTLHLLHVHYMHKIDLLEVGQFLQETRKTHAAGQCAAPLTLIYWDYPSTRPNCRSTYLRAVQWFSSFYFRTLNNFNVM